VLPPAQQGVVENNRELIQHVQAYLKGHNFCSTKRLRRKFNISGTTAAVVLKACEFEPYSSIRNGKNYRRKKKE